MKALGCRAELGSCGSCRRGSIRRTARWTGRRRAPRPDGPRRWRAGRGPRSASTCPRPARRRARCARAPPVWGRSAASSSARVVPGGRRRVDSTRVMAWASARRSPAAARPSASVGVRRRALGQPVLALAQQVEDRRRRRRGCWCPARRWPRRRRRGARRGPAAGSRRRTRRGCRRRLRSRSSSMSCGTSVLWPAAWLDTPTTCTSFSTAARADLRRASRTAGRSRRRSRGRRRRCRSPWRRGRGRPGPSWPPGCAAAGPPPSAKASTSATIPAKPSSPS